MNTPTESRNKRQDPTVAISPKVTWATAASAISLIVWTIVGALVPTLFPAPEVAVLTGATATVLTFIGGYLAHDPLRRQP